jgi:putative adhesin
MRLTSSFVVVGLALGALPAGAQDRDPRLAVHEVVRDVLRAYQGRARNSGPEQTERFSRKVKIGRDGRVSVENISGDITVTAGGGDEVSIDALKHTRGPQSELARVQIVVDERPGRVDVRTEYDSDRDRNRFSRNSNSTSVDYTLVVPPGAAVTLKSISGDIKLTGVQGAVRAETISGNITTAATPKLEFVKAVSGDINLSDTSTDGDVTISSISGNVHAKNFKARSLDLGTVSGEVVVSNAVCERLGAKSVSGNLEYAGTLAKSGRYELNSHSGTVRLMLAGATGFELNANSFSGTIRSEFPVTLGPTSARDDRRRFGPGRSTHAVFGDGSAALLVRTFSGDIVIAKR